MLPGEIKPKKGFSEWMRNYWRPVMAIQYLVVCIFDFVAAPICWTLLQAHLHEHITQWVPITLGSGGMYHLAMGAVLGVAAWTRSLEKNDEIAHSAYERGAYDHYSGYYRPNYPEKKEVTQGEPQGGKPLAGME